MSMTEIKKLAGNSHGKRAMLSPTPRMTRYQLSLQLTPKDSPETTPVSHRERKQIEAFSSTLDIVELDPITRGTTSHLGRYAQRTQRAPEPDDGAKMNGQILLESVTRATKACQNVSLLCSFLSGIPPFLMRQVLISFLFFFFRRTRNLLLFTQIMLNIMSKLLNLGRSVNARISM